MSYINAENEGGRYRVILGNHSKPTPAIQLAPSTTGIVVEGSINKTPSVYAALSGDRKYSQTAFGIQFREIREYAQKAQIPLASGEALASERILQQIQSVKNLFLFLIANPYLFIAGNRIALELADSVEELAKGSRKYNLNKKAAEYTEKYHTTNPISLKDLVIAQRASHLASFQQKREGKQPEIGIVVGARHIGVVSALETDEKERVERIITHPKLHDYYQLDSLSQGLYVIYQGKNWRNKVLVDPALKLPIRSSK